jgi:hypothetical protein
VTFHVDDNREHSRCDMSQKHIFCRISVPFLTRGDNSFITCNAMAKNLFTDDSLMTEQCDMLFSKLFKDRHRRNIEESNAPGVIYT